MKVTFASVANGGLIDEERIASALEDPCLRMYVESLEITVEDTALLFKLLDLDDSGVLAVDEFCDGILKCIITSNVYRNFSASP